MKIIEDEYKNNSQDDILSGLNDEQKEAVVCTEGPLLIIAGAGTGKTLVITKKIAYLIAKKIARPSEILALTFTEKAATEMQERIDILVPYGFVDVNISTFHAFGNMVLRENALVLGLNPDFHVLTRPEQIIFFREHLFEFPINYYRPLSDPTKYISAILTLFSRCKDEDVSPEEYLNYAKKLQEDAENNPDNKELQEKARQQIELALCYQKYQELLARYGKVDFGDQVCLVLKLFREHPLILSQYQQKYKYILVDEFQDTNYSQFQLVKYLAQKHRNITCVGDDDQSIYKWRGAALSNILNFKMSYPDAKQIVLIRNYRSPQPILDCAYRLIKHNDPDRLETKSNINKQLISDKKEGQPIKHLHCDTLSSEADEVAKIIEEGVSSGEYKYSDFAILVRANDSAEAFFRALNMKNIPWRFSGNQGLYSREEIRILISFLKVIANYDDNLSLFHLAASEIYLVPMLDLTKIMTYASRNNKILQDVFRKINTIPELSDISPEAKATISKIISDIDKYTELGRNVTTGTLLYKFITETGYLTRLASVESIFSDEKIQNIAKFFTIISNFQKIATLDRVHLFVNHIDSLISAGDDPATAEADTDVDAVSILTIHKAKGLEFRVVFLVSLVQDRFPTRKRKEEIPLPDELIKDILPEGDYHLQEERRLFYVGMTRAKENLYFTSARDYGGGEKKVSQFVYEALDIPKEKLPAKKISAIEKILRYEDKEASDKYIESAIPDDQIISLSYYQIDDYITCPLKYKYVHVLKVPLLPHHTIIYGLALHNTILEYYKRRKQGIEVKEDDMIKIFSGYWRSDGFLTREHEEQRYSAGCSALRKFYKMQEKEKLPTHIEKVFGFNIDNNKIIGRFDRVDEDGNKVVIIDFKSSSVKDQEEANKKTKESLQLGIYALAWSKMHNKIPDEVRLHFLESGIIGSAKPTEKSLEKVILQIRKAAKGIRERNYVAKPTYIACDYCAYKNICPKTASSQQTLVASL